MPNYRQVAFQAARRAGIDPYAFIRQMKAESGLRPGLTSGAGAQGIAQIMPSTAKAWGVNPNDPKAALTAAAQHMGQYEKQTGSLKGALEMYNLGHTAPDSQLPSETRNYVAQITRGQAGSAGSGLGGRPTIQTSAGGLPQNAQLALSLLGFGGSPAADSLDPLTLAMQTVSAKEASPGSQVTPSRVPSPYLSATSKGGTTVFDGRPVADWIAPILQKARQAGWRGTVTSGYRSEAKQAQLYQTYLHGGNIAAKPGQSNHEFTAYPGGAIDVSDPQGLNRVLQKLGVTQLKWAVTHGLADTPHFSGTGH